MSLCPYSCERVGPLSAFEARDEALEHAVSFRDLIDNTIVGRDEPQFCRDLHERVNLRYGAASDPEKTEKLRCRSPRVSLRDIGGD